MATVSLVFGIWALKTAATASYRPLISLTHGSFLAAGIALVTLGSWIVRVFGLS